MTALDLLGLGLLGLRTRPARAVLSALGIAIGIATMVVVTCIPASSSAALMRELSALGTNMLQATAPQGQAPMPEESVAMVERIAPVLAASAVANTHAVVRRSDRSDIGDGAGLTVLAAHLDVPEVLDVGVDRGAWLTEATAGFPSVVLGSVAAARLGVTAPDVQIMVGDRLFTVTGILDTTPLSPDIDRAALVGWPAARTYLGFDGHPTVLYVRAHEAAIEDVRAVLPATVNPQSPGNVQVTRPSDALAAKRATENTYAGLFLGLAAVALVVGGVGVANTMVVSVLERRGEIGLRRALGASRSHIRAQFLTEAVALSALGGVAGTALGVLAGAGWALQHGWPVVIPVPATVAGLGGALLVGALAGVYPSARAARLTPVEALASA
ncbi:ABC transporter permease [Actinoplanes sp. NPDC020271]|uniref:ABC transporter permease n=1 Tax=Actinoplanes sp. NPDC020271 TaxID=3363896 RepID=UPI00379AEE3A